MRYIPLKYMPMKYMPMKYMPLKDIPDEVQMETTAKAVVSVPAAGKPCGQPHRDLLP